MGIAQRELEPYWRRIGGWQSPGASLETLSQLIERHAAAIPFENVEVLVGRVPVLEDASLWQKMVQRRRGGYCFEQNRLFQGVLRQLGFRVQPLEARVRAGVPAEVITGRTHMALRVASNDRDWLVDVGFGGLAPLAPLDLSLRDEQSAGTGVYRFVEDHDELLMQNRSQDGWSDCYRFTLKAPHSIDHEVGNWFVATHPKSMLRQNLLVARGVPGGRLRLFNRTLGLYTPETGAPEERYLATRAELGDVLRDAFGLEIDAADLERVHARVSSQPDA